MLKVMPCFGCGFCLCVLLPFHEVLLYFIWKVGARCSFGSPVEMSAGNLSTVRLAVVESFLIILKLVASSFVK